MNNILKYFSIIFLIGNLFITHLYAQGSSNSKKRINLQHADVVFFENMSGENSSQRLIGNVKAEHDGSLLFCDSAYLYGDNSMDAFGHVHIIINDSLDLYGDKLFYNGNTKIAEFHQNVRMVDKKATLYTDELIYNRNTAIGEYFVWGRIVDSTNVLTSKKGYYYNYIETIFFKDSVVVVNPDYIMKSDTLKYRTSSERVFFYGPTTIDGDSSFLYAEDGFYDTKYKEAKLSKNAFIQRNSNTISGDSIYYNKFLGISKAFKNVVMTDTNNNVVITGEYGIYDKHNKYAFMVDSAQAIFVDEKDSLFIHADTLMLTFDSIDKTKELKAFYKMKFFRESVQGMADSMVYLFADSNMSFFRGPMFWFDDNQISSQRVDFYTVDGELDSAVFSKDVFLVSRDTIDDSYFNQLSGKDMYAWFKENDLRKILIEDNAESLFFLWEEDGTSIGMNRISSKDMVIYLEDQQLKSFTCIDKPKPKLYPLWYVDKTNDKLKGFIWKIDERPKKREDIFIWKDSKTETQEKEIKIRQ